ncbi:MAG: hypothetical protein M1834_006024 [Cirrosporium novae-zelandiae]|nr:MAG: hypothetical protein M1834_006024 [Cirrosporium novae-zelandiae]
MSAETIEHLYWMKFLASISFTWPQILVGVQLLFPNSETARIIATSHPKDAILLFRNELRALSMNNRVGGEAILQYQWARSLPMDVIRVLL